MKKIISTLALFAILAISSVSLLAGERKEINPKDLEGQVFGELEAITVCVNEYTKESETLNIYLCLQFTTETECVVYHGVKRSDGTIKPVQGFYFGKYQIKDNRIEFELVWEGFDSDVLRSMIYLDMNNAGNLKGIYIEPVGADSYARSTVLLEKL